MLMEMSKILCSSSFTLDSAHEKFDVWTGPDKWKFCWQCALRSVIQALRKGVVRVLVLEVCDGGGGKGGVGVLGVCDGGRMTKTNLSCFDKFKKYIKFVRHTLDWIHKPVSITKKLWRRKLMFFSSKNENCFELTVTGNVAMEIIKIISFVESKRSLLILSNKTGEYNYSW